MRWIIVLFMLLSFCGCAYLNDGEWPDTNRSAYGGSRYVLRHQNGKTTESYSSWESPPRRDRINTPRYHRSTITIFSVQGEDPDKKK